jgi:hypothetical protein
MLPSRRAWRSAFVALALSACAGHARNASRQDGGAPLFNVGLGAQCPDAAARAGTGSHDAGPCIPTRQVSYTADVVPIFEVNCATGEVCHQGTWNGPRAAELLVGVPASECCDGRLRVKPGDPANSYVIQKLRGVELCAGQPMPLGGTLSESDITTLSDWICEGAPVP